MSSAEPGLIVVFEGKRTRVRIFRRFFYPVQASDKEINVIVYSDTGQKRERAPTSGPKTSASTTHSSWFQ